MLHVPTDLITAIQKAYKPLGLSVREITTEQESSAYGACNFLLENKQVKFRVAKITPTKIGQFVTLWKRADDASAIMPFDEADTIDLFICSVRKESEMGQFVFPKSALIEHGYVSKNGSGGKRAIRLYPPWDTPESAQALKTQRWQAIYFISIQPDTDSSKLLSLLQL